MTTFFRKYQNGSMSPSVRLVVVHISRCASCIAYVNNVIMQFFPSSIICYLSVTILSPAKTMSDE